MEALRRLSHLAEGEAFVRFLRNVAEGGELQPVYGIGGERHLPEEHLDHLHGFAGTRPIRIGNAAFEQKQHDLMGEMILCLETILSDLRVVDDDIDGTMRLVGRLVKKAISLMPRKTPARGNSGRSRATTLSPRSCVGWPQTAGLTWPASTAAPSWRRSGTTGPTPHERKSSAAHSTSTTGRRHPHTRSDIVRTRRSEQRNTPRPSPIASRALYGKATLAYIYTAFGGINEPPHRFMAKLIKTAREGGTFLLTEPNAMRDFIHVDKVCEGLINLTKEQPPLLEAHLGSGQARFLDTIAMMATKMANGKMMLIKEKHKGKMLYPAQTPYISSDFLEDFRREILA